MPGFLGLQRFFGNTVGGAASYAAGGSVARVLHPQLQSLANEGWQLHPDVPVAAGVLANGVAQGQVPPAWALVEATRTGINETRFNHMVDIASTGPGVPAAFDLWRRGATNEAGFRRAAKRAGLEQEWIDALVQIQHVLLSTDQLANAVVQGHRDFDSAAVDAARQGLQPTDFQTLVDNTGLPPGPATMQEAANRGLASRGEFDTAIKEGHTKTKYVDLLWSLKDAILTPADLARGIHKSLIRDPGLLATPQPSAQGKVPAYPVYDIDALREASGSGYDRERLGVLVGLQGNPMGAHEAAQATFRQVIERADYDRAIAEGNTRNEWGDAIFDQSRQIPTARDFVENALRGYRDLRSALEGAALHGMTEEHATLIYQNQGRPMNIRAITQALARGAKFNPEPGELKDPYDASVVEGNIKPAYYEMAKALRYTAPSVFAIRVLAQSGVWDFDKTKTRLLWLGWVPEDADDVAKAWTTPKAATSSDPAVKSAETKFITAIHKAVVGGAITEQQGAEQLALTSLSATSQAGVLDYFVKERALQQIPPPPA